MNIVVDAAFLTALQPAGYNRYLEELWRLLAGQHPGDRFVFIIDGPFNNPAPWPDNVVFTTLLPRRKNRLVQQYWYTVKLPPVLKRSATDLFVGTAGIAASATQYPQLLMVPPFVTEDGKPGSKERKSLSQKRSIASSLQKAAVLTVISAAAGRQLTGTYRINTGNVISLPLPADIRFQPLGFEAQDEVKARSTGGTAYFILPDPCLSHKATIEVLKGFSVFKKRMQSGMKLVLATRNNEVDASFSEQLSTYKYKEDVVLQTDLSDPGMAALLASAYGALFPYPFKVFHTLLPEALRCGVPALILEEEGLQEAAGEACLSFSGHYKDVGEKMMQLYKEEALRSRLIQTGLELAAGRTLQAAAGAVWQAVNRVGG